MSNRCAKQQTIKDLGWGGDGTVDDSKKLCTIAYSIAHLGAQRKSGYSAPAYPDNRIITLTSTEPPAPVEVERRPEVATYAHILDSDTNLNMFMSEIYDNIDFSEFQTTTLLWDKSYSFMRVDFSVVDGIVHSYEVDRTSSWTNTLDGVVRGSTFVKNTKLSDGRLTVEVTRSGAADGMEGIIKHQNVQLPYTLHYKQETSRELISTGYNLGYFTLYCAKDSNTIVISFDGVYEIKKWKITYDDASEIILSNKERIGQSIGSTNITIDRRATQTDVLIFTPSMTNPTTVTFGRGGVSGQYWRSLYGTGATNGWADGTVVDYTTEDLSISPYDD